MREPAPPAPILEEGLLKRRTIQGTMETVLITGGAGFIGSHLAGEAVRRGLRVRVLDNLETGKIGYLAEALNIPLREEGLPRRGRLTEACELMIGDIRDPLTCAEACAGASVIFHEAARRSVPRSIEDPVGTVDANTMGTLRLLIAAKDAGVRRVVFASSSSVYGDNPALPKQESQLPQPISPYAVSKLDGEHYCRVFSRLYGLSTISLRYFNVFGPRADPLSEYAAVIPRFIAAALAGDTVRVHGDGEQSRDFTYVDNAVAANFLAMEAAMGDGDVFNVGGGQRVTVLELIDAIGRILGWRPRAVHTAPRLGDVRHSFADISAARARLGYTPLIDFEEGLRRTVRALEPAVREPKHA
jgi:nucleoside-diphosphate-sugar epimerase